MLRLDADAPLVQALASLVVLPEEHTLGELVREGHPHVVSVKSLGASNIATLTSALYPCPEDHGKACYSASTRGLQDRLVSTARDTVWSIDGVENYLPELGTAAKKPCGRRMQCEV